MRYNGNSFKDPSGKVMAGIHCLNIAVDKLQGDVQGDDGMCKVWIVDQIK